MSALTPERVRELLEGTSPAPWKADTDEEGWHGVSDDTGASVCGIGDMEDVERVDMKNGDLIAAAPALAQGWLQERERAEKAEAEAKQLIEAVRYLRPLVQNQLRQLKEESDWSSEALKAYRLLSEALFLARDGQ